jgi:hypothetical protein
MGTATLGLIVSLPCPQGRQIELNRIERLEPNCGGACRCLNDAVCTSIELEHLEQLIERFHQPDVAHTLLSIDGQLLASIETAGRRRSHLAHAIRREFDECSVRQLGHALSAPAAKIGYENVRAEVELRFVEYHPAAGAAAPPLERRSQLLAYRGGGGDVGRARPRGLVECARNELCYYVRRRVQYVLVGGEPASWSGHESKPTTWILRAHGAR